MSGEIHLQHIHLDEKKDRQVNPFMRSVNRQSGNIEDGSDYISQKEGLPVNHNVNRVSRQSQGTECGSDDICQSQGTECGSDDICQSQGTEFGSDYYSAIEFSTENENKEYETTGDINQRKTDYVANKGTEPIESKNTAEGIVSTCTRFLTKKKLIFGVVVVLVIVAIVSTVVTVVTLGQDGEEKLKRTTENQKKLVCPDMSSTGMNYNAGGKTGIQGSLFLVCFTENHPQARNQSKTVYILSDEDFEFNLTSKFLNSTPLYKAVKTQTGNIKEINVTNMIALSSFKVEQKALLIETTKDVSVIIIDNYIHSSDSSVILPITSISNSYVISTARPFNNALRSSQFAIASSANGTVVKIYFHFYPDLPMIENGITYRNGSEMIVVLNELQTYQIWHKADVSGTLINATSPVAVFAGSSCQKIAFENRSDSGYCSKLDEQLPPIDRLDKMFIVPPNYNRKGTILKIVSPFGNRLTYKIGNKQIEKTLKPSGYFEITFLDDEVVVIDSEKPILVTSFSAGSDVTGDPYMITVPGIRQYMDKYLVTVPENFQNSYIGLTVEEKSLYNLMLNETEILHYLNGRKFYATVRFKDITFVVLVLQVPGGMLKIQSTDSAAFGLVVYSHRKVDGHGFAGKAVLPDMCVQSYK